MAGNLPQSRPLNRGIKLDGSKSLRKVRNAEILVKNSEENYCLNWNLWNWLNFLNSDSPKCLEISVPTII